LRGERRIFFIGVFNLITMAKDKKSFIAYSDWRDTFDQLPDEDAGKLIKHIFAYVNDENPESDSVLIKAVFAQIKNTLKRDLEKWDKQLEQRRKAGKKSAEIRATKSNERSTSVKTRRRNSTDSVSVSVSDSVNVSVNDNVNKLKDIDSRKADFKKSLHPFLDQYDKDLLNAFYSYWTEHGEKDRKMRFEKQKSFGISRRLATWKKNESNFNNKKNNNGITRDEQNKQAREDLLKGLADDLFKESALE